MHSQDTDPENIKSFWQAAVDAEQDGDSKSLLNRANALEAYAEALRQENLRLLDAANAEALAKKLRAEFFKIEEANDTVLDWQIEMGLSTAKSDSANLSRIKKEEWLKDEQLNVVRQQAIWSRMFAEPYTGELFKGLKVWPFLAAVTVFYFGFALVLFIQKDPSVPYMLLGGVLLSMFTALAKILKK